MEKQTVTVRVNPDKIQSLDELAMHFDRDRSYVINEAIDQYLAHRRWMIDAVRKAVAEADAGEFLSDEECEAFMNELAR